MWVESVTPTHGNDIISKYTYIHSMYVHKYNSHYSACVPFAWMGDGEMVGGRKVMAPWPQSRTQYIACVYNL